ncbi:MAG: hypothetical protein E5V37_05270 [Mesorhizobium sp.]|nr:MAG: hypothetical protein E5V37_05270 [Mesorhizobium sp.]
MGGDRMSPPPSPTIDVAGKEPSAKLLISPLVGDMPGRAERGAVPPTYPKLASGFQGLRR